MGNHLEEEDGERETRGIVYTLRHLCELVQLPMEMPIGKQKLLCVKEGFIHLGNLFPQRSLLRVTVTKEIT